MRTWKVREEAELAGVARALFSLAPSGMGATVFALSGELGAGKTALVKALARELGINEHITSPTFVLMKKYAIEGHPRWRTLVHIDAYRIEDISEMNVIPLGELAAEKTNLICIEWPERVGEFLPEQSLPIGLVINDDGTRTITYGD